MGSHRRAPVALLACLLTIAAAAALAPTAGAYQLAGRRWPAGKITWYSGLGGQAGDASRAAGAWNRLGLGVTFVRTASKSKADVRVGYGQRGCSDGLTLLTVAHELGHVLGLGHENSACALMNPSADAGSGTPSRCRTRPLSFWVGKPLRADDIAGARALYG
jgi:Metallo-peptidase family M12B Reprolysin-like